MYGTIARMHTKQGGPAMMRELQRELDAAIPGHIATYVFQSDDDDHAFQICVLFEDKASYRANADSPEQDARYQKLRALLTEDPTWHDGEVVYADTPRGPGR